MTHFCVSEKVKSGYFKFYHPAIMMIRNSIEMRIALFCNWQVWKERTSGPFFFYLVISYSSSPMIFQVCLLPLSMCLLLTSANKQRIAIGLVTWLLGEHQRSSHQASCAHRKHRHHEERTGSTFCEGFLFLSFSLASCEVDRALGQRIHVIIHVITHCSFSSAIW